MNSSVYLFGNLSSGYTQYPDEDFSSEIFHTFYQRAKATTQIAIHRDGHLMYYCYIRKLEHSQYIGLCVLLNDVMIPSFSNMFLLFENAIGNLAEKGHLIRYNESGNLVANAEELFKKAEEIELITESLKRGFENLSNTAQKLPPENFSVGKDSTKEFTIEDNATEILQSSHTNGYTYIFKSKGFNTAQMTSYKGVLDRITKENNEIKAENQKLKAENEKILRQKKQFNNVILLTLVVIGCGFGLYLLNDNLNNTQGQLDKANDTIEHKKKIITAKENTISSQKDTIDLLTRKYNKVEADRDKVQEQYSELKNTINDALPFLFKKSSFSFSSGYYNISYYGFEEGLKTVKIQVIYPDGGVPSTYIKELYIYKGLNDTSVYIYNGFNSSKYYTFEILYNDRIIGGGRH